MRKVVLIGASLLLLLLVGVAAAAVWGYHFLEKPQGMEWLLKTANSVAQTQGVRLAAEAGGVSLFSGFHFQNLRVEQQSAPESKPLVITIGELKAQWQMSWWDRHLVIQEFSLKDVNLEGEVISTPTPVEDEEESSGENPWVALEEFPLKLDIQNFTIANVTGDLLLREAQEETQVSLKEFGDELQIHLASGLLELKNTLKVKANVDQKTAGLSVAADLAQSLDLNIQVKQGVPQIQLNQYDLRLLADLKGPGAPLQRFSIQGTRAQADRLSHVWRADGVRLDAKDTATLTGVLDWEVEFPLKTVRLETSAHLDDEQLFSGKVSYSLAEETAKLNGQLQVPQRYRPADVSLSPLEFEVVTKVTELRPEIFLRAEQVKMKGLTFAPEVQLVADLSDSARPTFEGEIKIDQTLWATLSGQAGIRENETDATFDIKLTPQGKLWESLKPPMLSLEQGLKLTGKVVAGKTTRFDLKVVNEAEKEALDLTLKGVLQPTQELQIEQLDANYLGGEVHLDLTGRYHLVREVGQLKGLVAINSQTQKLKTLLPDLALQGQMRFPFALAVNLKGATAIDGQLEFKKFEFKNASFELRGVNGTIPLSEDIKMAGDKFTFSRRLRRNGFERVDFNSFRPLLAGSRPLKIDSIHFEKRVYGPLTGFVSLQQNLLTLHQFDFHAGGARFAGESYVDLQPQQLQVGFLMRFSQVDFLKLLPQKYLRNLKPGPPLHGRTNFTVDLTKASIVGRTDVLEITANQLLAMLNIMDPDYKDDKINQVRSVLGYAYPTYVGLDFNHSYMDVRVDTNVGRLPHVKAVPIGSALNDVSVQITKLMAEVPLK